MDLVPTDILSGLPTSPFEVYLLVVTDYFTRWFEDSYVRCRSVILHAYIMPSFLVFVCLASYTRTKAQTAKVVWCRSFARSPILTRRVRCPSTRADGQTERANRTILQMLCSSIADDPDNWPARLTPLCAVGPVEDLVAILISDDRMLIFLHQMIVVHLFAKN